MKAPVKKKIPLAGARLNSNQPSAGQTPPRGRGRPRDPQVRDAILRAAREIIEASGPAGLTMEGVAARAGVGKPTVYRWWPDRHAVAMDAMMQEHGDSTEKTPERKTRVAIKALQRQLETVAEVFASRAGRNMASMLTAADSDSELAKTFRNHFVMARREEGRSLLKEALENGELRSGIDIDVALDMIYGALFFRLLMGHATLDRNVVQKIVMHAMRGLGPSE
jgi:AcrR family transcriptional regulator